MHTNHAICHCLNKPNPFYIKDFQIVYFLLDFRPIRYQGAMLLNRNYRKRKERKDRNLFILFVHSKRNELLTGLQDIPLDRYIHQLAQ